MSGVGVQSVGLVHCMNELMELLLVIRGRQRGSDQHRPTSILKMINMLTPGSASTQEDMTVSHWPPVTPALDVYYGPSHQRREKLQAQEKEEENDIIGD